MSQLAQRLARFLFDSILKINPKSKHPNLKRWAADIEKMLRIDKRSEKDIQAVIEWVFQNKFWCKNILSGKKLREKFDQLVMNMNSEKMRDSNQATGKSNKLRDWEKDNPKDEWQPNVLRFDNEEGNGG